MTKPKPTPARRQGRPSVAPGEATKQINIRVPASLAKALRGFSRGQMRQALADMVNAYGYGVDLAKKTKGATK